MKFPIRALSAFVVALGALALPACGGSGGGDGFSQGNGNGQIVLTSIAPNPMQGCGPHAFTISGQNFETVSGTTAQVTFRAIAPAGVYPFGGGSSDRATVTADVTSDTTIQGFTPPIVICGVAAITCEIDVMLESGVFATSTGSFTVVINAPAITNITPNPIPAALPTPFTVTGTGFGPVGGPATVRFTGDNGALLWKDGTKNFADVIGTVVDANTITGITPIATVCGVAQIGASVQVFFPDGCCTLPTPAGFVSFVAPTVTSLSLNPVPAAVQQNGWQITGTNFGPAGTQATVRFVADNSFALFDDGTTQSIDVPALVGGAGPVQTLTLTTPLAAVCGVAARSAAIRVISPYGSSCVQTATGFVTFNAPTITGAQAPIPGAIATPIVINGTNFGPASSAVVVRFVAAAGTPFNDGTTATVDVPGVVGVTPNTVNVTTPLVTCCTGAVNATVRVFAPTGGACVDSAANYLTFNAPLITTFAPAASNAYPVAPNTAFTITAGAASYGPVGSPVEVRFSSANGENIFGNGSKSETSVLGTIVNSTTITGTLPTASICGVASVQVNVRITLQNGSCQQTVAPPLTYNAPVITGYNGNNPTVAVNASNPTAIVIDGTGFAPLGGVVQVTFASDIAGPPLFGDGTQRVFTTFGAVNGAGTTITVVPPHATVSPGVASRSGSLQVTLANGACAIGATGAITFNAPTLTAFSPTGGTLFSAFSTGFTISGSGFGPTGSEVSVRFTAPAGTTPFGNGTQNTFEVPAVVTNSTTVTGAAAPLAALCGSPAVTTLAATARVIFQDGSQSSNTAAATYTAPAITTVTATNFGPAPVAFTITGTGFAPVGTFADVTFSSTEPIFGNATQLETTVTGLVSAANTVTGTTPVATICGITPPTVTVRVTFYGGSCATSPTTLTPIIPTIATITPSTVPATIPTSVTITGTGFGPNGSLAQVRLTIAGSPPTSTPFGNGSQHETTVTGTVGGGGTTITFFSPLASTCTANVAADVRVVLPNGSCSAVSAGGLTFQAPTVTTNNLAATNFTLTPGTPNPYTITGTNFAPNGAQVLVRYTATNPVFADGTSTQIDVSGTITAATTITTVLPLARVCVATTAQVRVYMPNGACADSPVAFVTWAAPTVTTLSVTNGPAFNPTATNITGTNFPPAGTPVVLHWSAASPIFAGGTSSTFEQFTTVTTGGAAGAINNVTPPVATTCATIGANLSVEFGNPNAAGCVVAAPPYTYNAPTVTLTAATTRDAIAPGIITSATLTGTNLPPNANVTVRFLAQSGGTSPYEGGSSTQAEASGLVNGTGTGIDVFSVPGMLLCGDNVTGTAALSVVLANGCVVSVTNSLTYTGPTITQVNGAAPPASVSANSAVGTTVTLTGTNFSGVTTGSIVTVRLTSTTAMFADGTSNTIDLAGTVNAANSVQFALPAATLCGVASANADARVFFADGSCDVLANAITFNAPQLAAAPGGFAPQNLAYAGGPFTITSLNASPNQFGPVGATVNVRFSVAAGTPFQGGTSAFVTVPGTIASATTVTGVAPAVNAAADTVASVNVRVEFEDGSCTNNVTTSYLRTTNRAAIAGGGNVYLLDENAVTLATTVAVAGADSADFAPALGRVYVTTGATGTVRIIDMNAGTTPGTGVPALLTTPSIAIAGTLAGVAVDEKYNRAWVVNTGNNTVAVIDLATNAVVRTFALGFPAGTVPTGRILWDPTNDRMLVPGINATANTADQISVFDTTLSGLIGTAITVVPSSAPNPVNTLDWTGGLALDAAAGFLFLSFNDADAADADLIQVRELSDLSVVAAAVLLGAGTNPSAVMAASPNTARVFFHAAGVAQIQAIQNGGAFAAAGAALGVVAVPTDIAVDASLVRAFMPLVNGTTQAFDTSTNANVGGAVATAGGTFAAATSP